MDCMIYDRLMVVSVSVCLSICQFGCRGRWNRQCGWTDNDHQSASLRLFFLFPFSFHLALSCLSFSSLFRFISFFHSAFSFLNDYITITTETGWLVGPRRIQIRHEGVLAFIWVYFFFDSFI